MLKARQTAIFAMLIAMIPLLSPAQSTLSPNNKSQQWRLAAINREWAAVTQENQAWECVKESEQLKTAGYLNEADRVTKLMNSAAKLQQAGDLENKAARNFDAAVNNWKRVTTTQNKSSENADAVEARTHIDANTENALDASYRAVGRYELAAELYRSLGPAGANQASALSEKAAGCREALANR